MKKLIILMMFGMILLLSYVYAEKKVENNNFIIECDKETYKVITGTSYAYCNITIKKNMNNKDFNISLVFEKELNIYITDIALKNESSTVNETIYESIVDGRIVNNKGKGLVASTIGRGKFKAKKGDILEFKIEFNANNFIVNDEFWVMFKDEEGSSLDLDPAVTGCNDNDTNTLICANGHYDGTVLNTTKNIWIYNATIDGSYPSVGNEGFLNITSFNGWIKIENNSQVLANGRTQNSPCCGGNPPYPGSLYINAPGVNGNIEAYNSRIDGQAGGSQSSMSPGQGATGAESIFKIRATNNITFYNVTSYATSGGGTCTTDCHCYGAGNVNTYFTANKVNITDSTLWHFIGSNYVNDCSNSYFMGGGIGNYKIDTKTLDIVNNTIYWDSYVSIYYGLSAPNSLVSQTNTTIIADTATITRTFLDTEAGTQSLLFNIKDNLVFDKPNLEFDYKTSGSTLINFSNTSVSQYKLGIFNLTTLDNTTNVYCAQPNILVIGNTTALPSKLNITSSCGTVTYVDYPTFFADQNPALFNIIYPTSGQYLFKEFYVNLSVYNSTVTHCDINNSAWSSYWYNTTYYSFVNNTGLSNGYYSILVNCSNAIGNITYGTINFYVSKGGTKSINLSLNNDVNISSATIDLQGQQDSFGSYPSNVRILINNTIVYQNTSLFDGTVSDINLNITLLQNCVNACLYPSGSDCLCQVDFITDTTGILTFSNINVVASAAPYPNADGNYYWRIGCNSSGTPTFLYSDWRLYKYDITPPTYSGQSDNVNSPVSLYDYDTTFNNNVVIAYDAWRAINFTLTYDAYVPMVEFYFAPYNNPPGDITVSIYNGTTQPQTELYSVTMDNDTISNSYEWRNFTFGKFIPRLTTGIQYWLVIKVLDSNTYFLPGGTKFYSFGYDDGANRVLFSSSQGTTWADADNTVPLFKIYTALTQNYLQIGDTFNTNITVNDRFNISYCQLYANDTGSYIMKDSTLVNEETSLVSLGFVIGSWVKAQNDTIGFYYRCNDSLNLISTSSLYSFGVSDITPPAPANITNVMNITLRNQSVVSNYLYPNISVNFTFSDENLFQAYVNVTCDVSGQIYYWEILDINTTTYTKNANIYIGGYPLQKCTIYYGSSDDHTANEIGRYKNDKIQNGLEFNTENNIKAEIISSDEASTDTDKKDDRYTFNFKFNEKKLEREFTVKSNVTLYPQLDSIYPGHFVAWNKDTKTGNWIDFAEIGGNYNYVVIPVNDNEYKVKISANVPPNYEYKGKKKGLLGKEKMTKEEEILDTYGIDKFNFESIGGTNILNESFEFYIGGFLNMTMKNIYDNTSVNGFCVNMVSVTAQPFNNTIRCTTGNYINHTELPNGTYTLSFNKTGYFSKAYTFHINSSNQTLQYITSQSIVNIIVRNVKSSTALTDLNITLNNTQTGKLDFQKNNQTYVTTFEVNASSYNFTVKKPGYIDYTGGFSLSGEENKTIYVDLPFTAMFVLYDENTLGLFNMSSPSVVKFLLICPTETYETIINTTTPSIPIICAYTKFKFVLTFDTVNYYRSFISTPEEAFNQSIYLIDLRTTSSIYNSLILDDLLKDYDNPSIFVKKLINTEAVQITSDYVDIEGKIGAYLIQSHEYIIEVHSDNHPIRVMGTYSADAAGDKVLRLYDITMSVTPSKYRNSVLYDIRIQNISGVQYATASYFDLENRTEDVTFILYKDSVNGTVLFTDTITAGINDTSDVEFAYDITGYENDTLIGELGWTHPDLSTNSVIETLQEGLQEVWALANWIGPEFLNWFFIILLSIIALYSTARTANMTGLVFVGLGIIFKIFNWFGSGNVAFFTCLIIAGIVALITTLRKGEENL